MGEGQVRPLAAKVEAIHGFPKPVTKKDLRAFLGLSGYYRRFIQDYASHSSALMDAISKDRPDVVEWSQGMEDQFEYLKKALTSKLVLSAFHPRCTTVIHTDASERGLGGALLQVDEQGTERPIAFYSRKLLPREQNYTVTEKECLAVVDTVKHFQVYLLGSRFDIVTDHRALLALPKTTSGGARVVGWALAL